VIGSGASGCQIADELLDAGRRVYLCVGQHQRAPRRYRDRDVFWWRRELGLLDETADEVPPERRLPPPLVTGMHGGYDVDLRHSAARGLSLRGHLQDIHDGQMRFADDLDANLCAGDRSLDDFVAMVDGYVKRSGLDVPPPPERDASVPKPIASPLVLDVAANRVSSVVWATGYHLDFDWIEVPAFDTAGALIHRRGVTAVPGLYFLGLPWLHKRKSTFPAGVGEDASFIADVILDARAGREPRRDDKSYGPGSNRDAAK
jgi:putative flavoprotein involved in K+ transport